MEMPAEPIENLVEPSAPKTQFLLELERKREADTAAARLLAFIGQSDEPPDKRDSLLRDLDVVREESRLFGKGQAFSMAKDAIDMELEKLMKPD